MYKYLGVYFDEHLEFDTHCKILSEAGTRALGSTLSKFRYNDDITYEAYTKLFECNVNPVTDYGAEIWGFRKESNTDQVQLKAIRNFLGVHKHAPNLAILSDMGWIPSPIRRKVCLLRYWNRLIKLDDDRLTKHVFNSDYDNSAKWCMSVYDIFKEIGLGELYTDKLVCDLEICKKLLMENYSKSWKDLVLQKPKLRTYCQIKENFGTEKYVKLNLSRSQRSFLAQLRSGTLPLQIETGRFRGIDIKFRQCHFCDQIEDEYHFLFDCCEYVNERHNFLSSTNYDMSQGSQADTLRFLCTQYARRLSKYVSQIWNIRKNKMYN